MLPPAPGRFSTTMLWPTFSESFFTMMRAVMSVPPPGANPTTIVTGRFGNVPCARAPAAAASAMTAAEIPLMVLPQFSPRLLKPRVLFSLEQRFSLLHESAPALDVILAPEALLHERRARLRVERRARFQQLADDALGRADRERRVLGNHRAILEDERFQLRDRRHAVHEAHRFRLAGAEMASGNEHLARVRRADNVDQVLQRRGAIAQAQLRRRDAEPRVLRGDPQVAAERDVHARPQAISADHGDDHLVAALQALGHAAGDLLVVLDSLGARALLLVLRDIRAGDEGLVALAFQRDYADLGVLLEAVERLRDRLPHVDRDGVPPGGVVEREPADRPLFFGDDSVAERARREGRLFPESEEFFLGHEPCARSENRNCKPCRAGATWFPAFIRALRRTPVSGAPLSAIRCACGRRTPRACSRRPRSRSFRAVRVLLASAARVRTRGSGRRRRRQEFRRERRSRTSRSSRSRAAPTRRSSAAPERAGSAGHPPRRARAAFPILRAAHRSAFR